MSREPTGNTSHTHRKKKTPRNLNKENIFKCFDRKRRESPSAGGGIATSALIPSYIQ
jgi:hypothetical protein